jgi:hypothetical protein
MAGKHRTPEGEKSTSEKVQGTRNDASKSKHRATGETTQEIKAAGSDLPSRDGSKKPGTR